MTFAATLYARLLPRRSYGSVDRLQLFDQLLNVFLPRGDRGLGHIFELDAVEQTIIARDERCAYAESHNFHRGDRWPDRTNYRVNLVFELQAHWHRTKEIDAPSRTNLPFFVRSLQLSQKLFVFGQEGERHNIAFTAFSAQPVYHRGLESKPTQLEGVADLVFDYVCLPRQDLEALDGALLLGDFTLSRYLLLHGSPSEERSNKRHRSTGETTDHAPGESQPLVGGCGPSRLPYWAQNTGPDAHRYQQQNDRGGRYPGPIATVAQRQIPHPNLSWLTVA